MIVTFFGHRKVSETKEVQSWLLKVCEDLIKKGADKFYLGGYGNFDNLAYLALKELKTKYTNIEIILILAYQNRLNNETLSFYDGSIYPELERYPKRFVISKRNEWMVLESVVVVGYQFLNFGGAYEAIKFARRHNRELILFSLKDVD